MFYKIDPPFELKFSPIRHHLRRMYLKERVLSVNISTPELSGILYAGDSDPSKVVMKNRLGLILSLCFFGLCSIANAIPIYLLPGNADIAKNGTGGGGGNANANNDASNLFRLETVLHSPPNALLANGSLNSLLPANLPLNVIPGSALDYKSNVVGAGGLTGFDFAVLHYGSGQGGTPGGGVQFFFLNGASEYTFPDKGTGPNGNGGFSSLTLFKGVRSSVPDGGSTVVLLGGALGLIAVARRKFRL
jgi:VPDSG-CTERM motif